MSLTGVAKRAGLPSDDARATPNFPDITIGPDILELLSSAMYVDPITIYREYVQNAADAVDVARCGGILAPDQLGRVDISIDAQVRSVRIRDNGCGVPSEAFGRRLLALGGSEKRGTSARGFRGVGRLAGLGYAREVIFRASAAGETITSELRWDCRELKAALLALDNVGSAADVIRSVTSLEQQGGTDADEHFFEVELKGMVRLSKDQLTSPTAVGAYLSQVAPVPFAPDFRFGTEITTALSRHMDTGTLLIHINGAAEPIYRPHRDRIACDDKRQVAFESVDVVEFGGIDGNVAAVKQVRTRLNDAQRDLYRRLGEAVERVGERLREDENGKPLVFRDSLIENIRELVDVVPRLNIFADDDLTMLCREVKDKFAGIEPDALRPSGRFDPNLRRQVKRYADALTAQFAGYFAPAAENREAA